MNVILHKIGKWAALALLIETQARWNDENNSVAGGMGKGHRRLAGSYEDIVNRDTAPAVTVPARSQPCQNGTRRKWAPWKKGYGCFNVSVRSTSRRRSDRLPPHRDEANATMLTTQNKHQAHYLPVVPSTNDPTEHSTWADPPSRKVQTSVGPDGNNASTKNGGILQKSKFQTSSSFQSVPIRGDGGKRASLARTTSISEKQLRLTLAKFVPKNVEDICVARHTGSMDGTLIKRISYAQTETEILRDDNCCSFCARNSECEFWVRDMVGDSCWLMKDFRGFNNEPGRRSSFSASWASQKRQSLQIPPPPRPGSPGIGEIGPNGLQSLPVVSSTSDNQAIRRESDMEARLAQNPYDPVAKAYFSSKNAASGGDKARGAANMALFQSFLSFQSKREKRIKSGTSVGRKSR